jgi:hypothetical protein
VECTGRVNSGKNKVSGGRFPITAMLSYILQQTLSCLLFADGRNVGLNSGIFPPSLGKDRVLVRWWWSKRVFLVLNVLVSSNLKPDLGG